MGMNMPPQDLLKKASMQGNPQDDLQSQVDDPNQPHQEQVNKPVEGLSADEERKMTQRYMARYQLASVGMDTWHEQWRIIDLFDRGRQWDMVQLPVWLPKPITNLIRFVRTTKRANLALSVPQANFIPLTPADTQFVNQIQKGYDHIWAEEHMSLLVRRSVDRTLLQGTAIAYVYAEENIRGKWFGEGHPANRLHRFDVKAKRINNANFYIDPTAYNIKEAKYATITENLAFSDVKNNPLYQEYAGDKLKKLKFADMQKDSGNGDIFDRDTTKQNESLLTQDGDEMVTVHIHWERYRNENGAWQVDVSYFLWNTDFLLYRIEDFKPSELPFAVLYDEEEENSFWGSSTGFDMLENQKIINKTAQAASIIATLQQNPQKIVLRESGINAAEMSRTGTLAGKVWTSNVPKPVEVIPVPDIPKGLFDIEDRMKQDIRDMAGITEAYQGQSVGSLTTSTGVDSLIERATIRDRDKAIQIDRFVEELSDLIVKFMIVYWQEPRPLMTRQNNGEPNFDMWKPIPPEVIDNLEWRVHSDIYAHAPMTAASRSQQADNLMQLQGQFQYDPPIITPEEWIDLKDFPNKQDILARMQVDRFKKQQQDATQLEQQIIQIIGQAQQMKATGATDQQVQQQVSPMVQQVIEATFTQGQNQGSANSMSQSAPRGTTSPTAMGNMTQG